MPSCSCLYLFIVSTVDCNLQQADNKNNMGYRITKKGYAAFVHTIWNIQVWCLPTHMLICFVVWKGLPFCVQCLLMSCRMFQAFAADIVRC